MNTYVYIAKLTLLYMQWPGLSLCALKGDCSLIAGINVLPFSVILKSLTQRLKHVGKSKGITHTQE